MNKKNTYNKKNPSSKPSRSKQPSFSKNKFFQSDRPQNSFRQQRNGPSRSFSFEEESWKIVHNFLLKNLGPNYPILINQSQQKLLSKPESSPLISNNDSSPIGPIPDRGFKKALAKREFVTNALLTNQTSSNEKSSNSLDEWQEKAFIALCKGKNIVVDAPTSAGKTRVIEAFIDYQFAQPNLLIKLIYTSPVKSLSNDKYREFCEKYGKEKVGINTGDFKENLSAPIVLATLETYRNSLLGVEPYLGRRLVVYDEYHYLQDESRGSAWEESIVLTPPDSQLVLLSASVPNAEDFANWIHDLKNKDCEVVRVTKRPVPLVHIIHTPYGFALAEDLQLNDHNLKEIALQAKQLKKHWFQTMRKFQWDGVSKAVKPAIAALNLGLGPIIIYAGRRADVETLAYSSARSMAPLDSAHKEKLLQRITNLQGWEYVPSELQKLIKKYGVAYHHSGMIPPGRVAIETLLKEGLLKICTGTMGISLGVNFAVRSALISDETRPSEGGSTAYSGTEIMQMLGRAGRRGFDTQGYSIWPDLLRFAQQRPTNREPCTSALKIDPSTVLGLLGQREDLTYLKEFYNQSFFLRGKSSVEAKDQSKRLDNTVEHLTKVKALKGSRPTLLGQLARHFPQVGGLIVAKWLAEGEMTSDNFDIYVQGMASFCSTHFKEIPAVHTSPSTLSRLNIPKFLNEFYPQKLFPELYDELRGGENGGIYIFREFNEGAPSIVSAWLRSTTTWGELVNEHTSRYFSAGDCMMVLFRFSTFLQSCSRIGDFNPSIAQLAKDALSTLLREPLDARNRMVFEETAPGESPPIKPPEIFPNPNL